MRLGITLTIHTSITTAKISKARFAHSRGHVSQNSSAKVPELTTSWCFNLQTVRTKALVDHGGFPFRAAIHWSRSSLHAPAVLYIFSGRPSTPIWIHSHPLACCFIFPLVLVLYNVLNCAFWVIFVVAALASSWWTDWCLCRCCVSVGGALVEVPVVRLDSDPLAPCRGVCGAMICCCGGGKEDDNEKKWEVLRNM